MIVIIDYNAGNLASVKTAISHVGFDCIITNNINQISKAKKIIFPGVGAAGSAMNNLKKLKLDKVIKDAFLDETPILGICLGTQIILDHSLENNTNCLGLIPGKVEAFSKVMPNNDYDDNNNSNNKNFLKIPHMGWNAINITQNHPVLDGINNENSEFYFVHSYYTKPTDTKHILATTNYGINFSSIIGKNNLIATQFHPEKSGRPGLNLLKNFCKWNP